MEAKIYRPTTLLSVVGKIFESIYAERVIFLLLQNKVFDDAQEGFRSAEAFPECSTSVSRILEY